VLRKLQDQDPWPDPEESPPTLGQQFRIIFRTARDRIVVLYSTAKTFFISIYKRIKKS
jgi:hypothetical protein